ncbi:MAG: adenine phosphoribosyltransferase [Defluviitaleaceae bacterium]|nr:adenine phosphoribosyltransferase [Defluviitaleaceae bacterium]
MENTTEKLMGMVRSIQDFPEPGVLFRDITTVLKDAEGLRLAVDALKAQLAGVDFDLIAGPESRGFIFGVPIAYLMGKGFIPVRKAGKLPAEVVSKSYSLEYGQATIEAHKDAIAKGQKIVIVDDLLATGGTARAISELVGEMGAEVAAMAFFIELEGLGGRKLLDGADVRSVIRY